MRKVVVAADSFKGSLSSVEVGRAIARGIHRVFPRCEVREIPIADGGEGSVEALMASLGGEIVVTTVDDPLGRPIAARYGIAGDLAMIELAAASGLTLLAESERNPALATTFGTGQLIVEAIGRGCRRILMGIGGSATNDGGTGMLRALGFRFLDVSGNEVTGGGGELHRIARIDAPADHPGLAGVSIEVACDVTNPFCGPSGAAYVFAPQKGADKTMVEALDAGMAHFAEVVRRVTGTDIQAIPGAGAAGGVGGACAALLGARLVPGAEMILRAAGFARHIEGADLVITGEGRLDAQTAMGKAPAGVLAEARKASVPVIAIGGAVEDAGALNALGFRAVFPIQPSPVSLCEAMERDFAAENIERTVIQIMRLL